MHRIASPEPELPRTRFTTLRLLARIATAVAALAGTASRAGAGGRPGSLGVGGELQLSGVGGLSANYDAGRYHVGGFLGYHDPEATDSAELMLGARFYYHVASTAASDFGVGGSLGVRWAPGPAVGDGATTSIGHRTQLLIEPGFQIRTFIAANVALSFLGGLALSLADPSRRDLGAQFAAGVHYYF